MQRRDENGEGERPDQVNPAAVLVKACQGQKYTGFQDVLDGSLEQGRECQFMNSGAILTWVGSQPENQAGKLDLTEK